MGKIKQIEKLKHPNSRQTKMLAKQIQKKNSRDKSKLATTLKLNAVGEKCKWFGSMLDPEFTNLTPGGLHRLIEQYLSRFDEEMEQIRLKHSIGNRKNRQHANREDIIRMTIERERGDYNTCGIELPDVFDINQFNYLQQWKGELRYLQNFKFKKFSKKFLEDEEEKRHKNANIME
ncbi:unnamed protein product [Diabrotica balteata]|uniref:Translation machinery-associated protein 16 homolog n=1 Tax=Diabrotica balteata TaxID=107213 RepID=A0A9P0DXN5_DIABA|nr:unnamed protein product [Diabrotica balteata]